VKKNEDIPMLSATKTFVRDSRVSGGIRFVRIFATFSHEEASINRGVVKICQFSVPLVAICSESLKIRPNLSQKLTTEVLSMDCSLCGILFIRMHAGVL